MRRGVVFPLRRTLESNRDRHSSYSASGALVTLAVVASWGDCHPFIEVKDGGG